MLIGIFIFIQTDSCGLNANYNKPGVYYPYNHVDLTITYHSGGGSSDDRASRFDDNGGRIISVKVNFINKFCILK